MTEVWVATNRAHDQRSISGEDKYELVHADEIRRLHVTDESFRTNINSGDRRYLIAITPTWEKPVVLVEVQNEDLPSDLHLLLLEALTSARHTAMLEGGPLVVHPDFHPEAGWAWRTFAPDAFREYMARRHEVKVRDLKSGKPMPPWPPGAPSAP
ncbi:hypothetical protein [Streptomyces microflavus]|uniref:hypothetical protein n=1 Tax=Streptomyces microflavus TaxID=1919 RepID=UPI003664FCCA